jgi:hypothetical protein
MPSTIPKTGIAGRFAEGDRERGPPELGSTRVDASASAGASLSSAGQMRDPIMTKSLGADRRLLGPADQTKVAGTPAYTKPKSVVNVGSPDLAARGRQRHVIVRRRLDELGPQLSLYDEIAPHDELRHVLHGRQVGGIRRLHSSMLMAYRSQRSSQDISAAMPRQHPGAIRHSSQQF